MPIIVADKSTGKRFILVGTGYTATETAALSVVAACSEDGSIVWLESDHLVVVEIDGQPPSRFLASAPYR